MSSAENICGAIKARTENVAVFRFTGLELLNQLGLEREPGWPVELTNLVSSDGKRKMTVYVHDAIGPSIDGEGMTSADVVPRIQSAADKGIDWLHFDINSPGGSVSHAMSIFNAAQEFRGKKTVDITGVAGSAAGVLAMIGDNVRINENAQFFMHPANVSLAYANAGLLKLGLEMVEKGTDQIIDLFSARSGKDRETVRNWLFANDAHGTIFTGRESVENGLCDEMIPVKPRYDSARARMEIVRNIAVLRQRDHELANLAMGQVHQRCPVEN